MTDILFVCYHIKKIRRTIGPTDGLWADFTWYENGTSMSVQLGIRIMEKVPHQYL